MIYGTRETPKEAVERQFGAIVRAYRAEKKAGRKPKLELLDVAATQFGIDKREYGRICSKVNDQQYHGVSSDVLAELIKERWARERAA